MPWPFVWKQRKDLVFMWRSRLYSDVRISLTGNFGGSHESPTTIFSSHRFILISRSSYFHAELLGWPTKSPLARTDIDQPTMQLPSPPFTPASLHFTLGFIYTGTLVLPHRSYDLSTAFAILRAALYLAFQLGTTRFRLRLPRKWCLVCSKHLSCSANTNVSPLGDGELADVGAVSEPDEYCRRRKKLSLGVWSRLFFFALIPRSSMCLTCQ